MALRPSAGLDLSGVFRFAFVLFFVLSRPFSCTPLPKRKAKRGPKSSKKAFRSSPGGCGKGRMGEEGGAMGEQRREEGRGEMEMEARRGGDGCEEGGKEGNRERIWKRKAGR